jgi:hypothetical protein
MVLSKTFVADGLRLGEDAFNFYIAKVSLLDFPAAFMARTRKPSFPFIPSHFDPLQPKNTMGNKAYMC